MKLIGLCDRGPKCYIRRANTLMTIYDDTVAYRLIKIASLPQNTSPLCMFLWSSASGYSVILTVR